jgi:predicted esterase
MIKISTKCSASKTIAYGRSMGATIAAHSMANQKIAGLILESAAPSLSIAVNNHLRSKWYLTPLSLLPISTLLPSEYKLSGLLSLLKETPIAIFQGTHDTKTPLNQLENTWNYNANVSLHTVENGLHSNTHIKAQEEILKVAKSMVL